MPAQLAQEHDQVGRPIALGLLFPRTQLAEQPQQLLLHRPGLAVDGLQAQEHRGYDQPLLRLPHIVLGSRLHQRIAEQPLPPGALNLLTHLLHQHLRHEFQHHRVQGERRLRFACCPPLCPLDQ